MSHRIWRESKLQQSRARSGNLISCCLLSLHFLCDILQTFTVRCTDADRVRVTYHTTPRVGRILAVSYDGVIWLQGSAAAAAIIVIRSTVEPSRVYKATRQHNSVWHVMCVIEWCCLEFYAPSLTHGCHPLNYYGGGTRDGKEAA